MSEKRNSCDCARTFIDASRPVPLSPFYSSLVLLPRRLSPHCQAIMATVKIFTALSYHSPHEQCPSDAEQAQRAAAAARLIHLNLAARSTSTVQPAPPPAPTPSLQVGILKRASSGNPPSSGQDANETRTQPAKKRVRMDLPEEEDVVEPSPKSSRALDSGEEDPREDMLRKTVPHSSFYSKPASSSSPAASGTRARSTRPSLPSPPQELTVEVEAPTSSVVLESYEAEKRGTTDLGTAAIERCIPAVSHSVFVC